ncbi:hypothetical protein MQE36_09495 [Zhouia spongiae]|uniref:Uncharacterized protein n=1 Tax=Zhouia spongiae TaxID=2202721 RepID=A0ABY3YI65_9FLAO|nr:hypothetical protein [Zhouia spongiae]UNY97329.1 hypothetical protein MQE36_09495 [Zhouia spongiae]
MKTKETYCLINIKCTLFEKNGKGEDFHIDEKFKKILISNDKQDIDTKLELFEKILNTRIRSKEDSLFTRIKKYLRRHIYLWKHEYYELLNI